MLNDDELAGMIGTQDSALPDRLTVLDEETTRDGKGGSSTDYTEGNSTSCRLRPISGNRGWIDEKVREMADSQITYPVTFDLTAKQRIRINNTDYEVLYVAEEREWETARRAAIKRCSEGTEET